MILPDPKKAQHLAVFARLWDDPVVAAFFGVLEEASIGNHESLIKSMALFARRLYDRGTDDWTAYLQQAVVESPGCFEIFAGREEPVPYYIMDAAFRELGYLSKCAAVGSNQIVDDFHAKWKAEPINLFDGFMRMLLHMDHQGTGIFNRYTVFRARQKDDQAYLQPLRKSSGITFDKLWGYEREHDLLKANTKALVEGKPANNVLLYGPAGTGKSASIKAVANEFSEDGLRLIEMDKEHLDLLPDLMEQLAENPLKFVIFIDDLSFQPDDERYALLKGILEGSSSSERDNVLIYATSNRRHVVKESGDDRDNDLHPADQRQEMISLSDRFGLQILFEKPTKKEFLELCAFLAREYGLQIERELLDQKAEQYALSKGGRSARTARQLVQSLIVAEQEEEKE